MCITGQCPDPTKVGIWWRDDTSWKLYSKESMRAILQARLKGNTYLQLELLKSSAHPDGASYLIDLSKMEQTNQVSGHKRAIKLIVPPSYCPKLSNFTFLKEPHNATTQGVSEARFLVRSPNCWLVVRLGNIVEWKVDGEVDAVVNPCSARGSLGQLVDKGRSSISTEDWEEMPTISSTMKGPCITTMSGKGGSSRSIHNSGKTASTSDESEQLHGGVAAALHRAAGPALQVALQRSAHFESGRGRCGDAVITPGFELPASHVVHTFAPPVYRKHDEASSVAKLEKTYNSALSLAALHGIRYIAFPAISCGAGSFPLDVAASVALQAACKSTAMLEIHFVLLDQIALSEWITQASCKSFARDAN